MAEDLKKQRIGPAARALGAADELFYRHGYRAVGINEIIDAACVAKDSFYKHFGSKKGLLMRYLQQRRDDWNAEFRSYLEAYPPGRDRLLGTFDFLRTWLPATGFRGCAFLNVNAELPAPESDVQEFVADTKDTVRKAFRGLAAQAGSPPTVGDQLFVLFEGATIQSQVHGELWPVDVARDAAATLLASTRSPA